MTAALPLPWVPNAEPVGPCRHCGQLAYTADESGHPCHLSCGVAVDPVVVLATPTGTTTGPCARCGEQHERYGDRGAAWCTRCRGVPS